MNNEKFLETLGFVKSSTYRVQVLKYIGNGMRMPSEIGEKLNISTSSASNILISLKTHQLVVCINPNMKKGRLYKNTELALEILKFLY